MWRPVFLGNRPENLFRYSFGLYCSQPIKYWLLENLTNKLPLIRASDNSRKKKWNFTGFEETNSRRKRPISRDFRGNFRGKCSLKSKQESKKERFLTKILEGCQIQGKKETQKFIQQSSEGNCTWQEKHIT